MQHTIMQSYQTGNGSLVGNMAVTGDTEINSDVVLAPAAVNVELDVDFKRANAQCLGLECTGDCTIKTNSSSAPQDTIVLTANQPLICKSGAEVAARFGGDVTKLFLSSTAGGTFSVRILLDETP
jgi:hypothetical protein